MVPKNLKLTAKQSNIRHGGHLNVTMKSKLTQSVKDRNSIILLTLTTLVYVTYKTTHNNQFASSYLEQEDLAEPDDEERDQMP
jgi:hypothetical protein